MYIQFIDLVYLQYFTRVVSRNSFCMYSILEEFLYLFWIYSYEIYWIVKKVSLPLVCTKKCPVSMQDTCKFFIKDKCDLGFWDSVKRVNSEDRKEIKLSSDVVNLKSLFS